MVEIIPGKGSGALKKHVFRFLDRPGAPSRHQTGELRTDRLYLRYWRPSDREMQVLPPPGESP